MKLLCIPLLILWFVAPGTAVAADPIDKVAELLKRGNTAELTKMLAPNITITLQNEENVYTRAQAGIVLDKFFGQNKPIGAKVLHRVNSSASYLFGVILVNTEKGAYRIACTLKEAEGSLKLIEIRIEPEKMK